MARRKNDPFITWVVGSFFLIIFAPFVIFLWLGYLLLKWLFSGNSEPGRFIFVLKILAGFFAYAIFEAFNVIPAVNVVISCMIVILLFIPWTNTAYIIGEIRAGAERGHKYFRSDRRNQSEKYKKLPHPMPAAFTVEARGNFEQNAHRRADREPQTTKDSLRDIDLTPPISHSQTDNESFPEGILEPYWNEFLRRRELLKPFELKFREEFDASDGKGHDQFSYEVKRQVKKKIIRIMHRESELNDSQLHLRSCRKRDNSNHANGWVYWFQGNITGLRKGMASYLLENSSSLVELLKREQGLWFRYLNSYFSGAFGSPQGGNKYDQPDHLHEHEFGLLWRSEGILFELLAPGFYSELGALKRKMRVRVRRSRGTEEQLVDELMEMRQLVLEIADEINEFRPECPHYDKNICIICGELARPDLWSNLEMNIPNEVCSWCWKVFDYHDQPIFEAGKSPKQVAQEGLAGFKLAVEYMDFPYWRSPYLTRNLIKSLGLRDQKLLTVREAVSVLAAMPRHLCGFESVLHFLSAAGLEDVAQPTKGRGKRTISTCNHLCLSMGERDICEFLFANGIEHEKEPFYADLLTKDEPNVFGGMRGDYLVGQTVIEYAGLSGNSEYDSKIALKISLCASNGINLIVVYPNELNQLSEKLSPLLDAE